MKLQFKFISPGNYGFVYAWGARACENNPSQEKRLGCLSVDCAGNVRTWVACLEWTVSPRLIDLHCLTRVLELMYESQF